MRPAKLYVRNLEALVVACCQRLVIHQGTSRIVSYLDGFFVLAACVRTGLMPLGCVSYDD
jgi:hypothetical protein